MSKFAQRLLGASVALLTLWFAVSWIIAFRTAHDFADELLQAVNRNIAMYVAARGPLMIAGAPNDALLDQIASQAMTLNPGARLYLLDAGGYVVWPRAQDGAAPVRVRLEPLRRFLAPAAQRQAVRGADPRDPRSDRVFSAAPLDPRDAGAGYIYVVFDGAGEVGLVESIAGSHILRAALATLGALLLLALVVSFAVMRWLTRPVERLHARVLELGGRFGGEADAASRGAVTDLATVNRVFDGLARRLENHMSDLESTDRLRRELLAHVSHDLRTPLTAMRGYLETLASMENTATRQRRAEFIAVALRHCQRLHRLVERVFVLARLDAAAFPLQLERVSIAELAQDVVSKYQLPADEAGIALVLDVDPEAPSLTADLGLMETVLENLVDNALRYSSRGGRIVIRIARRDRAVEVSVSDDGEGIAADDLLRMQQAFVAGPRGRSGLGLAIVRRVLECHGSALELRSVLGRGTEASFRLSHANAAVRDDSVIDAQAVSSRRAHGGRASHTGDLHR